MFESGTYGCKYKIFQNSKQHPIIKDGMSNINKQNFKFKIAKKIFKVFDFSITFVG